MAAELAVSSAASPAPTRSPSSPRRLGFAAVGIAAAVLSLASSILLDLARLDDGRLVGDSADIVLLGADHTGLFRWSGLLDMLGSYLLFLPLALWLRNRFHGAHPTTVDIGTMAAVVYGGVGAAGAAAWAGASPLISDYASAAGPAAAVWVASVAISVRDRWRGFAVYSALLAAATGLASIGAALSPNATSTGPGTLFFLPLAVWPAWLAVRIWRDDVGV